MRNKTVNVPQEEIEKQYAWMHCVQQENAHFFRAHGRQPVARVRNFGCQMNEHDSEKLAGMLSEMGYILTDGDEPVDLSLIHIYKIFWRPAPPTFWCWQIRCDPIP